MVKEVKTVFNRHKGKLDWLWKATILSTIAILLGFCVSILAGIYQESQVANKRTALVEINQATIVKILDKLELRVDDHAKMLLDHSIDIGVLKSKVP